MFKYKLIEGLFIDKRLSQYSGNGTNRVYLDINKKTTQRATVCNERESRLDTIILDS